MHRICTAAAGSVLPRIALPLLIGYLVLARSAGVGNLDDADALAQRGDCEGAQMTMRAITGSDADHPADARVPEALERLGECWTSRGRYDAADLAFERAVDARARTHGADHPSLAPSLHAIGWLATRNGRFARADRFLLRALEIRSAGIGAEHPDTVQTLGEVAFLRYQEGRTDDADELNLRSLEIRERTLGGGHLSLAESLNLAGLIQRARGRMREAEREFARALEVHDAARRARVQRLLPVVAPEALLRRVSALAADHPDVGAILSNLAEVQASQGRVSEAVRSLERAIEILERGLGREHPHLGGALSNLASLYRQQGRLALADRTYARAASILRGSLPSDHPHLVAAERDLAADCRVPAGGCRARN